MQPLKIFWRTFVIGSILLLAACAPAETPIPTVDTAQVFTQVAQTIAAQFTQTSAAMPIPTDTAVPAPTLSAPATFTPVALPSANPLAFDTLTPTLSLLPAAGTPTGVLCNNSIFIRDVGIRDGAILKPGQNFEKGWVVQNTGVCTWGAGYTLVQTGGNTDFNAATFTIRDPLDFVEPGEWFEISLKMTAPRTPNMYEAHYQMYSDQGIPFGTGMTIRIEVRR
jgi:hypothetical protein